MKINTSEHQKRLWFIDKFEKDYLYEGSPVYHNLPFIVRLNNLESTDMLKSAIDTILQENAVLRTRIVTENDVPLQVDENSFEGMQLYKLEITDEASLRSECIKLINRPFNIDKDQLIRFDLLDLGKKRYVLLITAHHLIADKASLRIIFRKIKEYIREGSIEDTNELKYSDYSDWQNEFSEDDLEPLIFYWKRKIKDAQILYLDTDEPRDHIHVYDSGLKQQIVPAELYLRISEFCAENKLNTETFFVAAFNLLLYKYSGLQEIVIGTLFENREQEELKNLIGPVANLLVLKNYVNKDNSFKDVLEHTAKDYAESIDFSALPFERAVAEANPEKDMSRTAVFDVMIHFEDLTGVTQNDESILELNYGLGKYDFNLLVQKSDQVNLFLTYNKKYFTEPRIIRLLQHFVLLLGNVLDNSSKKIGELAYLSEVENDFLINKLNDTNIAYPNTETIISLFEKQVLLTSENTALVFNERSLTYKELNETANKLADYIRMNYDTRPEDLVGIKLERNEWIIIAMLAVLKAGAAYVPVDPEYPEDRINFMLEDSACKMIIDQKEINAFLAKEKLYSAENVPSGLTPSSLAYVIYTSGTTGKPKGSLITHKNLVRLFRTENYLFDFNDKDVWTMFHSYCFDFSVWEMYGALVNGAKLVLVADKTARDPGAFLELLIREKVTVLNQTPSAFYNLIKEETGRKETQLQLRYIIFGGEMLNPAKLKTWKERYPVAKLINMYGITETTVHVTYKEITEKEIDKNLSNIGKPIPTLTCYVMDQSGQLLPIGVGGELYVGGEGVARGYLNRKELTVSKFIADPFNKSGLLYRSGDKVRMLENGEMEYLGRIDDQVKVRGYRIELGEIENAVQLHEAVESAVVIARTGADGEKDLVGYIVANEKLNTSDLRNYLKVILPGYMIPAYFVQMENFPLNSNGKIDKKALPAPDEHTMDTGAEYIAPRNEKEQKLAEVWQDVLKRKSIGVKDNFFELGGDSIKSLQIVSRLRSKGYSLKVQEMMTYLVLEDLAEKMQPVKRHIPQEQVSGEVVLTPIQKYFLSMESADKHHFNQAVMLFSKTGINETGLDQCLAKLIGHHDTLRHLFMKDMVGFKQQCGNSGKHYSLNIMDLSDRDDFVEVVNGHANEVQAAGNISRGPLFRTVLFRCPDGDRLLLVAHHLIIDTVSWRIILEDLETLYNQYLTKETLVLPLKTDSFQLWAAKLKEYAGGKQMKKEYTYWAEQLKEKADDLPLDNAGGSNLHSDTEIRSFTLSKKETALLTGKCNLIYNTGVNDLLLSSIGLSLKEVFNMQRITFAIEGHGREQLFDDVDISRTVGWFTSLYPVMLEISSNDQKKVLVDVKEKLHRIPNKGLGYGMLLYLSNMEPEKLRAITRSPQIEFNFLGDFGASGEGKETLQMFELREQHIGKEISGKRNRPYQLSYTGMVIDGRITINLAFSKHLHKVETVEELLSSCKRKLQSIILELSATKEKILTPSDLTYKNILPATFQDLHHKGKIEDVYSLSPLQEGIYFHWLSQPASRSYFEQTSYTIKGELNVEMLKKSFLGIVKRHAILRTSFTSDLSVVPLQIVWEQTEPEFEYIEFDTNVKGSASSRIEEIKQMDIARGLNLADKSHIRVKVISLGDNTYEFIWSYHHILMDGWCIAILISEFYSIYSALTERKDPALAPVLPYSDYIKWIGNIDKEVIITYWKDYLRGCNTPGTLPFRETQPASGYEKASHSFTLEGELWQQMEQLCRKQEVTMNTLIQAVWGILLARYNNTDDIVFGSVVSGRPPDLKGVEEMIGLFINTIPVRVAYTEETIVSGLLKQMKKEAVDAQPHHFLQLADLKGLTEAGAELFDHAIVFENFPVGEKLAEGINEENKKNEKGPEVISTDYFAQNDYDFSIMVVPGKEQLVMNFVFNARIYQSAYIERAAAHFKHLIRQIAVSPGANVRSLSYITEEEKKKILYEFNGSPMVYPSFTVIELFEEQVRKTPGGTALIFNNKKISYSGLNDLAAKLGRYIVEEHSVRQNDIVAVKLERSEWWIVSLLAVLKTGAAYLPVDPLYPADRIEHMITDSSCVLVIDDLIVKDFLDKMSRFSADPLLIERYAGDAAYMIYTSGSSGLSKGVLISNSSLVNYVTWSIGKYNLSSSDTVAKFLNIAFDASVEEIYPALLSGATIHILPAEILPDASLLNSFVNENSITVLVLPAAVSKDFLEFDNYSLRLLISGGDNFRNYQDRNYKIFNHYGPTETTVTALSYPVTKKLVSTPVGKPISNVTAYIFDESMQLCPVGIAGELCIGGAGLAIGYHNREELNHEKFIANPFAPDQRLYRTGDLTRWLPDGNIVYEGRKDDQVKIRGYRIEPAEIENLLLEKEGVKEAIIIVRENEGEGKELLAFIVSENEDTEESFKQYLKGRIPPYMVPAYIFRKEQLPLTANGKVDKKALLLSAAGQMVDKAEAAELSETEQKVAAIWRNVIERNTIAADDDFFELGGHSLKAVKLLSIYQKELEIKLSLQDVFTHTTVKAQARLIEGSLKEHFVMIDKAPEQASYPLSDTQRRLWVLSQFDGASAAYNSFSVTELNGDQDISCLEYAVKSVVERHEILRTVFREDESGDIRQWILSPEKVNVELTCIDFRNEKEKEQAAIDFIWKDYAVPFNLSKAPLIRLVLLQMEDSRYLLYYKMHHIITDGWSKEVLTRDMLALYNAYLGSGKNPLAPLRIQYKDFAYWQQQQIASGTFDSQRSYWLENFNGELPVLNLMSDKQRPPVKTYNGSTAHFSFGKEITDQLRSFSTKNESTLFMTLLASIKGLLYRYTGQEDLVIGSPFAGRGHADLQDQIGCYLNTLAIRSVFNGNEGFENLVEKVRKSVLGAFENKDYPFDKLVEELNIKRDTSRSPLFDILFVLQNFNTDEITTVVENNIINKHTSSGSQFDISFVVTERKNALDISVEYNRDVFSESYINQLIENLHHFISSVLNDPQQSLSKIAFIPEESRKKLLAFNPSPSGVKEHLTLVDLLNAQFIKTPDHTALIVEDKQFTYGELDEMSDRFVNYLADEKGIAAGDFVGIKLARTEALIVSLLAVLKVGAVYVPLDISYPEERIAFIQKDSSCKLIIDEEMIGNFRETYSVISSTKRKIRIDPENLSHIIYTSGSTGNPKGVMIRHLNVSRFIEWCKEEFAFSSFDIVYAVTSVCFDLSVYEIFYSLCSGKTIRLLPDGTEIAKYIGEDKNILINTVPSVVEMLLQENVSWQNVRVLNMAGEPIPDDFRYRLDLEKTEIRNLYGPSEDTVYSTFFRLEKNRPVLIGKPIANTEIYIFNPELQLQPLFIPGEILIGGMGLSKGYLNLPELTNEKFIPHPYFAGEKLYRTGDVGRWLPDGNIEFLGRKDYQVKIRGYRIELEEVETALRSLPQITEAVVKTWEPEKGKLSMVAYVVTDVELDVAAVNAHLRGKIPAYMIPEYYIQLAKMPLTPNGKTDRKALPHPAGLTIGTGNEYVAPENKTEQQLVKIYAELLGKDPQEISILDNFFDLGGNSIKIIQLNKKINQIFERKESVTKMFLYPSIREFSDYLDARAGDNQVSDESIAGVIEELDNTVLLFNNINSENESE